MSVADKLGSGSSFGKVPHGRSPRGRAKAVAQGDVPAYELVRVQVADLAPSPLLPQSGAGSEAELTEYGESLRVSQLTACVGVSREAYLTLWPDHEAQIGAALVVLVSGRRTYQAAVHVGLEALDFVVRDDLAGSREVLAASLDTEDERPPAVLALEQLAHNPFNPREALTDVAETAESLRVRGQIQPITVARRAAFLGAHPGQDEALGSAQYVVIDGNRRLAAARSIGLENLRVSVNDDLAASAADLLEAALIANIHRVDVPAMDQARAVQELTAVHGSQAEVARRLGKTGAWVSQRLALLELTPDLQEKVETGELKVEPARRIGRLPVEKQAAAASAAVNAVKAPRQRTPRAGEGTAAEPTVNAVKAQSAANASETPEPAVVNGVNGAASPAHRPSLPATQPSLTQLMWESPTTIVEALVANLTPEELIAVAGLLMERITSEVESPATAGA